MQYRVKSGARLTFFVEARNSKEAEELTKTALSEPIKVTHPIMIDAMVSDFRALNITQ